MTKIDKCRNVNMRNEKQSMIGIKSAIKMK